MRRRPPWALMLVLGLVGCEHLEVKGIPRQGGHPTFSGASPVSRQAREDEMNRQWQNRSLDELVGGLGKPILVMNIPGGGMPPGFAVVYERDTATGCIDAFAVNGFERPTVRVYYCR